MREHNGVSTRKSQAGEESERALERAKQRIRKSCAEDDAVRAERSERDELLQAVAMAVRRVRGEHERLHCKLNALTESLLVGLGDANLECILRQTKHVLVKKKLAYTSRVG